MPRGAPPKALGQASGPSNETLQLTSADTSEGLRLSGWTALGRADW